MTDLASRAKRQPPPPRVVWRSLAWPNEPGTRPWLDLADGEVAPRVLRAVEPELVEWSSLWPARPDDRIRFDLTPRGGETLLRWTLTTPGEAPGDDEVRRLRHRLNVLVNANLRFSYG